MQGNSLKLSELNNLIRTVTEREFSDPVWVIAEILELNVNRSGHCYLELIEKSEIDNSIVAKTRATIWAFKFRMLRPYFESVTGTKLQAGIKVLIKAEVTFHEIYSLSLNIIDIDPSYTMGDIALRKREVIKRLEETGLMNMNKELPMPEVPQRLAIISSETAAGLGDFIDSMVNNSYNFGFSISLFPALVQGEGAEKSMIKALEKVYELEGAFDLVVLIRGGGSQADLDCFNGFDLALNIAQFPIPVVTGIGHERDETISDMVAHKSLKTPTAAAEYIINKLLEFLNKLDRYQDNFEQTVRWIIQQQSLILQQKGSDLNFLVQQFISEEKFNIKEYLNQTDKFSREIIHKSENNLNTNLSRLKYLWKTISEHGKRDLNSYADTLDRSSKYFLNSSSDKLNGFEKNLQLVSPEKVLSRGYSISYVKGKILKSVKDLEKNTSLTTKVSDGIIESNINRVQKSIKISKNS